MGNKGEALRQRIVIAADQLFYHQGYENTSFSDIADAVGISRGNFYYHFKTKDEILDAVIDSRVKDIQKMLDVWSDTYPDPEQRLLQFIDMQIKNQDNIKNHGCPVGSLCTELAKHGHVMLEDANQMLTVMRNWLTQQFKQLGLGKDARQLAMHLLARSQGIALITNSFEDQTFLRQEVKRLKHWLEEVITPSAH